MHGADVRIVGAAEETADQATVPVALTSFGAKTNSSAALEGIWSKLLGAGLVVMRYFLRLLHEPSEGRRVVYAALWEEPQATPPAVTPAPVAEIAGYRLRTRISTNCTQPDCARGSLRYAASSGSLGKPIPARPGNT
jgi:hypothetical protein